MELPETDRHRFASSVEKNTKLHFNVIGPLRADIQDLQLKIIHTEADLTASENIRKRLEEAINRLEALNNELTTAVAQANDEKNKAAVEMDDLAKQLVSEQKMHESKISEMHKSKDAEINGIVSRLKEKYQKKIGNLEQQVTQQRSQNSTSDHNSKQSELKSENVKLKERIAELEKNLKTSSRSLGIAAVTQSEDFDMEIDEVGPGPSCARTPARHPPRKGTQSRIPLSDIICKTRKDAPSSPLTDGLEANGKGNVNIVDVEPGKVIRIINNGKDAIPLKGWRIEQNVNDSKMTYNFNHLFKLAPGFSASVWSSGAEIDQEPRSTRHIEMKTGITWMAAPEMKIQLIIGKKVMDEKICKSKLPMVETTHGAQTRARTRMR